MRKGSLKKPTTVTMSNDEINFESEKHRAFVRDVNSKLVGVYGYGGGGVLVWGAIIVIIAWYQGVLGHFATWIVTFTMMLIALYVLRNIVRREKTRALKRVQAYCEANKVSDLTLREDLDPETFSYFFDLFKEP